MRQTLITGATSGLGRALVDQFMATDNLIAIGRNKQQLEALSRLSPGVTSQACDLARPGAAREIVADRQVDVLINNAGVLPARGNLVDLPAHAIDAMIDINLRAVIHLTQAVLPGMRARGKGHLVFIGSSAGHYPHPGSAVYGATKAAISLFADALRAELVGERIRVTEISPGRIRSNLYRDAIQGDAGRELYDEYEPLEPEDVARTVAFALDAPGHVDISRMEVFPTSQVVGGGRIVKISDIETLEIRKGD